MARQRDGGACATVGVGRVACSPGVAVSYRRTAIRTSSHRAVSVMRCNAIQASFQTGTGRQSLERGDIVGQWTVLVVRPTPGVPDN